MSIKKIVSIERKIDLNIQGGFNSQLISVLSEKGIIEELRYILYLVRKNHNNLELLEEIVEKLELQNIDIYNKYPILMLDISLAYEEAIKKKFIKN